MKAIATILLMTGIAPGMSALERPTVPAAVTLPPLPDAHGFAGMFAGISGGALLCAGGANFPEQPLAQGGKKVWHDQVFVLPSPDGAWQVGGRLPSANGYGISATWRDAVVVAGGGNAQENFRTAYLIRWNGAQLSYEALPDLPVATANGCGAVVGDTLFVAGGQETPTATTTLRRCYTLDLAAQPRTWTMIPWPDEAAGRILAVAATHRGAFYFFSGADLYANPNGQAERRYLNDAWRYNPGTGWQRLQDLPHAVAAAASPAMDTGTRLVIAGGVSPEFLASLSKGASHPGFPGDFLAYDNEANQWVSLPAFAGTSAGTVPPARVTAPQAAWNGLYVIPSGEISPGVRTPTVLGFKFSP